MNRLGQATAGLIFQIVLLTFIVLKLAGVISWAWWWGSVRDEDEWADLASQLARRT